MLIFILQCIGFVALLVLCGILRKKITKGEIHFQMKMANIEYFKEAI